MERKKKYRSCLLVALGLTLLLLGYSVYGEMTKKMHETASNTVSAEVTAQTYVMPVGQPVGLYIHTQGVMVLGTGKVTDLDGNVSEPAKTVFKAGDYIQKIDGTAVSDTDQALALIQASDGEQLTFDIIRDGEKMSVSIKPVEIEKDIYKAGIWLRDDTQGIGTITYVDANQHFAALGHGITDVDTGLLIKISHGMVYWSKILSVVKGLSGTPGEIVGTIDYQTENRIGTITENTSCGIFGTLNKNIFTYDASKAVPIADKSEVEKDAAQILCCVDGETALYDIEIEKINSSRSDGKNFVIRVTDEALLAKTNGILQGMSGSPILQNGKLIGAVTHVFVNDPAKGYGIFAENMLEH